MTALGDIKAEGLVFGTEVMVVVIIIVLTEEVLFHSTHQLS